MHTEWTSGGGVARTGLERGANVTCAMYTEVAAQCQGNVASRDY